MYSLNMSPQSESDSESDQVVSGAKAGRQKIQELRSQVEHLQAFLEWEAIKETARRMTDDRSKVQSGS
jgi:hypothetical protein